LRPTFVPARLVGLAVKRAFAFILYERFPTVLSAPSYSSVTLWRRPPQSNYPPYIVLGIVIPELEPRHDQGGISRMAPPRLASRLQSLPPILHKSGQSSM